jgi:cysteine-S-conjugate beta-lyase
MWVAETDVVLAPAVSDALRRAVEVSDTGYANPGGGLSEAFAAFADQRWGWTIEADDVRLAPDVGVAMIETLRTFVRPGDKIAFSPPVYPPFFDWVREVGCEIVEAPLTRDDDGWRLDLAAIERAFDQGARAYLLCNPHNPVGRVHSREELAALAVLSDRYDAVVVSDEIHAPLALPGSSFTPYLAVDDAARSHGLALHSASKAWNLAGLKCALIVAPNGTADGPARVRAGLPAELPWRAGHLGVLANKAAYADGAEWLDRLVVALDDNRRLLEELLHEHLPRIGYVPPQASYLAWLDAAAAGWGADPTASLAEQCKVALSRGLDFGRQGAGFLRLNLGCSPETLREAVRRMAAFDPERRR